MHMLPPDDVKRMHPRKPLAPYTAPTPLSLAWQSVGALSSRFATEVAESRWCNARPAASCHIDVFKSGWLNIACLQVT